MLGAILHAFQKDHLSMCEADFTVPTIHLKA